MIRAGYLSAEDRADLIALARDGSAAHRLARRANALVLLDDGWSCERVADALLLDDDTIRRWHGLFVAEGLEGLTRFEAGGGASHLSKAQEATLKAWITAALPRSTRAIGAFIEQEFGVVYESRAGLIAALVHGYRRGGILRGVGQMFTVAITGVCRAVQVKFQGPSSHSSSAASGDELAGL